MSRIREELKKIDTCINEIEVSLEEDLIEIRELFNELRTEAATHRDEYLDGIVSALDEALVKIGA